MARKETEKNEEGKSNIRRDGVAGQDVREGSPADEHLSLVYLRQESCYFSSRRFLNLCGCSVCRKKVEAYVCLLTSIIC